MSITFKKFIDANIARADEFFDKGNTDIGHWTTATSGEMFEAIAEMAHLGAALCDTVKRSNGDVEKIKGKLAHEYADCITYFFIKSGIFKIPLERATLEKFNLVSDKIGSKIKLDIPE